MATQRTTPQVGVDPPRGVIETALSPVVTTLPRHDIDVNHAGAPIHLQGYQTHATTSHGVNGLSHHSSYHPSNVVGTQPHTQHHASFNDHWQSQQGAYQSFDVTTQSPTSHPHASLHPMSSTTATVSTSANHAFPDVHASPNLINPLPVGSLLHGGAESPPHPTPQDPPTYTPISITADRKRYRCGCGHQTKTVGDMERHHESSQHSEPKHFCGCGKKYSRKDGLTRHQKKCIRRM